MKIGTKSLLFGIHQFIWHPIVVRRAWVFLYGRPSFKELICIIIHDWGYWGKPNLDGKEGIYHPSYGAYLAGKWFGLEYARLCSRHSRSYIEVTKINNPEIGDIQPSKLCWADKLSFCFEPRWFYLLRARLSGEVKEAIELSIKNGIINEGCSDKQWFNVMFDYIVNIPEIKELIAKKGPF